MENFQNIVGSNNLQDAYLNYAKESFQQMVQELQTSINMHQTPLPTSTEFLLTQLNAWQNASQNLQQQMNSIQTEQPHILNTVFRFEPDHFKMLVDVRGYQPSELKVSVSSCGIELTANHEQTIKIATGSGYANRVITRVYELPLNVYSEQVACNLSPEGVLFISAPWSKRP